MGHFDKNMPRFERIWGVETKTAVKEKPVTYKVKEIIVRTLEDEMKFEILEEMMDKYSLVEIENVLSKIK